MLLASGIIPAQIRSDQELQLYLEGYTVTVQKKLVVRAFYVWHSDVGTLYSNDVEFWL